MPNTCRKVPAQANDDVVHVNVHLDLSDGLDEPDEITLKMSGTR